MYTMSSEIKRFQNTETRGFFIPFPLRTIIELERKNTIKELNKYTYLSRKERNRRRSLIEQKFHHTYDVIVATENIIMESPYFKIEGTENNWDLSQADTIAVFHD